MPPEGLQDFLAGITRDAGWAGLSVTAPHKEALLEAGEPDHVTKLVRAGNTLVTGDVPMVHNTDVPGFVRAWRRRSGEAIRTAVVVGNGATARSLLVALAGLETSRVTLLARIPERATVAQELGRALGMDTRVQPLEFDPGDVDLVASTIPAPATAGHAARWAAGARALFDAVYDPWPTPLGQAATSDHVLLTGLDLLAGQAVDQFHLLTGASITFDQAYDAAADELARRQGQPPVTQ